LDPSMFSINLWAGHLLQKCGENITVTLLKIVFLLIDRLLDNCFKRFFVIKVFVIRRLNFEVTWMVVAKPLLILSHFKHV